MMVTNLLDKTELSKKILYFCRIKRFDSEKSMDKLHYFADSISLLSLPEKFTYPFHYTPHPLCVAAAEEVGRYLETKGEWQAELQKGKMFGVLIVRTGRGKEIGRAHV